VSAGVQLGRGGEGRLLIFGLFRWRERDGRIEGFFFVLLVWQLEVER
jgi:hypothetical protein